jgi:hypothetical protein
MLQSETRVTITVINKNEDLLILKVIFVGVMEKAVPVHTMKGYKGVEVLFHLS